MTYHADGELRGAQYKHLIVSGTSPTRTDANNKKVCGMTQATSARPTLRQRWHRLRTSPRFPLLLLLGLLIAGLLSQVYYFWWDLRIERMLIRNNGYVNRIHVYPQRMKKYLGDTFVSRFEPIEMASLRFDVPHGADHRPDDLQLFRGALFLRELSLSGKLTDNDVSHLKRLRQLKTVHCWSGAESAIDGLVTLPNLTYLSFTFEDAPDPTVFQKVATMPQLERLSVHLGSRGHGLKTVEGMRQLAESQSLYRLDIQLNNDEFLALTNPLPDGSQPLPSLAELRLSGSNNGTRRSLDNLKHLPDLIHLDLSYWELTDADLLPLKQLPHLRTLYVEANPGITDKGAAFLASMRNLQSVNVKNTNVSNEGLFRLATLPRLRCLRAYPQAHEGRVELRKRLPAGCQLDTN